MQTIAPDSRRLMDRTNSNPITVLHVVTGLDAAGGVMHVATELARGAQSPITSYVWKHRNFVPVRDPFLFVCQGGAPRGDYSLSLDIVRAFRELPPLLRWISGREGIVLHAHTRVGILASCLANKITGCALVIHIHACWQRKWFYRGLVKWTDASVVFTSAKTYRFFGCKLPHSTIAPPCIPWPARPCAAAGPKRFVAAASFVAWKNLQFIIRAFNELASIAKGTELVLFGRSDRPFRQQEQDHIVSLAQPNPAIKVRDHDVRWMEELTANDVFVHAADQEPFGIVILEAFSRGCRCVVPAGTFLDDLPEPIRSRGIYRCESIAAESVARQMQAAMNENISASELWALRRTVAHEFSIETAVNKLSTVYKSMLKYP